MVVVVVVDVDVVVLFWPFPLLAGPLRFNRIKDRPAVRWQLLTERRLRGKKGTSALLVVAPCKLLRGHLCSSKLYCY